MYQTTQNFCQRFGLVVDHDELLQSVTVSADKKSMQTTIAGLKVPGFVMSKLDALPDNCSTSLVANKGEANYQFNPEQNFEIFWQTFNEFYAFFHLEGVDWNEIYQIAESEVSQTTSQTELFEILSGMVAPLKDFHVSLENEDLDLEFSADRKSDYVDIIFSEYLTANNLQSPLNQGQVEGFFSYFEQALQQSFAATAQYFPDSIDASNNASDTLIWHKTDDNIGYLYVQTMDLKEIGDSDANAEQNKAKLNQTLDQIMADFAGADGIVLDVRYNGGGDDFVSQMIVSRFIDQPLHAYSKQARLGDSRTPLQDIVINPVGVNRFSGPVAVLTSTTTSSAAEIFSMSMRERNNTVLIGEATAGGFSDTLPKTLPDGTEYTLSNEFYITPAQEAFEGSGVPVNIEQPVFSLEHRQSGTDPGMQKAIDWIKQQG